MYISITDIFSTFWQIVAKWCTSQSETFLVLFDKLWQMMYISIRDILSTFCHLWQNYVLLNQRYSLVLFDELWQMVYLLSRDILSTFGQIVANDVHLDQRHSWVLLNKLWQMMYIWYIRDIHEYFLTSCSKWCTSRSETFLGTLWRVVANILINSKREKKNLK